MGTALGRGDVAGRGDAAGGVGVSAGRRVVQANVAANVRATGKRIARAE